VLWRKLPGAKSAGRVQSVCLRLIVEREMEIEAFRAREYWTVAATLPPRAGRTSPPSWSASGGKKLDKFDMATAAEAAELAVQAVRSRDLTSLGRGQTGQPQPLGPVHDLDLATGSQPQIRHGRQAMHVARAAPV
jgi:DNA topoisomerase IA